MTPTTISALKQRMQLPVIAAPMFLVSGTDMVIAACRNGVMGSFPGTNARTITDLRQWLDHIDASLGPDDAPWAFNMIVHNSYGRFDEELALVEEYQPGLVITALGGPHRVTQQVHGYGGLVFADVNSPRFARKAIDKGADGPGSGLCRCRWAYGRIRHAAVYRGSPAVLRWSVDRRWRHRDGASRSRGGEHGR